MRVINKVEGITVHSTAELEIDNIYIGFPVSVDSINYDYTIIGTRKEVERELGGIKELSTYSYDFTGTRKEVVIKYFNYIYSDPDNSKIGLWLEHVFLTVTGAEGVSKINFIPLSIGEVANIRRKQRVYAISRLKAIGIELPETATYIETLINHYSTEIDKFEKFGTNDFYNSVLNEVEPTIVAILNTVIIYSGISQTVEASILEQLSPHL